MRSSQPSQQLDAIEALLGAVVIIAASVSIVSLVCAQLGAFHGRTVVPGSIVLALAALWRARRSLRGVSIARSAAKDWIAIVAIAAVAAWLFFPPVDARFAGGDASIYLATGRHIMTAHGLKSADPVVAAIPSDVQRAIFLPDPAPPYLLSVFPGGVQVDANGAIEFNFFHLVPAWMATFDTLFGPLAGAWVEPAFGVMAILLVWAIGRRLSGSMGALFACALLVVNVADIWFAKLATSEMSAQFWIAASLLATLVIADTAVAAAGVIGGVAAGLAGCTRIDALLMASAPLIAAALWRAMADRSSRRAWTMFAVAGAAASALACIDAWFFAHAYTERLLQLVFVSRWSVTRHLPIALGLGVAAILLWAARGVRLPRAAGSIVLALAAIGAIVVAWLFGGHILASPFVLLITRAGLALAVAGLVLLFAERDARTFPLVFVFLASAFVYLQDPRDPSGMPMLLRRYVPVLLPIAALLIAHLLARISRNVVLRVVASAVAVAMVVAFWLAGRPMLAAPLYRGVDDVMNALTASVPSGALTLFDFQTPSHLALAFRYHAERPAVMVSLPIGNAVARVVDAARGRGERVFLVMAGDSPMPFGLGPRDADFGLRPVRTIDAHVVLPSTSTSTCPVGTAPFDRRIDVYEVVGRAVPTMPVTIDVGEGDLGWWPNGFYPPESMQNASARWTMGRASVAIGPIDLPAGVDHAVLSARFATGRDTPVDVQIIVGGQIAGTITARSRGFASYMQVLSGPAIDALRRGTTIEIAAPTFVPADTPPSTDHRALGLAIDWIRISTGQ